MRKEKKQSLPNSRELDELFKADPPDPINSDSDNKSEKEQLTLFNFDGPYSDFNEYMRHEEFIIKKLNSQSERQLREKNAKLAFRFSAYWASFIAILILLKGFEFYCFFISDNVFLVIIGSLTASILIFYSLVLKYLFNIKPK